MIIVNTNSTGLSATFSGSHLMIIFGILMIVLDFKCNEQVGPF